MKGLLLKDAYMAVKLCKMFFLFDILFIGATLFAESNPFYIAFPCVFSGMLPMMVISYEEQDKWEHFAGTLPYTRAELVSSKYLLALISNVVVIVLIGLAQALRMAHDGVLVFGDYSTIIMLLVCAAIIPPAILYPFIYKFGVAKGRIVYYLVFGAGWGATLSLSKLNIPFLHSLNGSLLMPVIVLAAVLLYVISWRLSVRFYKKREL